MTDKYDLYKMLAILDKTDQTGKFLESCFVFENLWKNNLDFRKFVADQSLPAEYVAETIKLILGDKICAAFLEYLLLLLIKQDILKYTILTDKLFELLDDKVVIITVVSAKTITDQQQQKLQQYLSTRTAKQVFLRNEIQPDILGGIIIKFKEYILDLSVKYKLERMREKLAS